MSGNPNLQVPDQAERAKMSREELGALGMALDGVELAEYGERYIPGSPADKRAERQVAKWFLLAGLMAVLFIVAFIWWPSEWVPASSDGQLAYALYTPIIGATLGATILFFGIGVVAMAKKIMPHEVAIQQRHIGMSDQVDRQTLAAQVLDVGDKAGIKRRGMLKGSLLLAGGGLGIAAVVPVLGGFIKNPWAERADSPLWGTPVRPEDLEAGSMATVFPGVPGGAKASDAAVMLFRVRSDSVIRIRDGQQGFQFGDYYAYSKICTHVGCPVSLYEQQTGRVLCPCHQSQFNLYEGMFPVFGPATRPLPQLPIELDDEGYFVAAKDFVEAVGPGFWENGKFPAWYSEPKEATG
jgi:ubiquinol-cytochrome c reductase iron-sulfur subunit